MTPENSSAVPVRKPGIAGQIASFGYAIAGLRYFVRREVNARIHLVATAAAVGLGFWRGLDRTQWVLLLLTIGAVWTAEALNTAIEMLCDLSCGGQYHPVVKRIKDIASGAVLVAAAVSVVVGALLFF